MRLVSKLSAASRPRRNERRDPMTDREARNQARYYRRHRERILARQQAARRANPELFRQRWNEWAYRTGRCGKRARLRARKAAMTKIRPSRTVLERRP